MRGSPVNIFSYGESNFLGGDFYKRTDCSCLCLLRIYLSLQETIAAAVPVMLSSRITLVGCLMSGSRSRAEQAHGRQESTGAVGAKGRYRRECESRRGGTRVGSFRAKRRCYSLP